MTDASPATGANRRWLGVLGDLVEDTVVWLAEPMRPGSDTAATVHRRRGGSAANVAAFAAGLCPTRFIGSIGADEAGAALVRDLRAHGVEVRVQRPPDSHTGTIVVLIDESGERSMFPDRGAATALENVDPGWVDDLAHLHVPAYAFASGAVADTARELLGRVRSAGAGTSVDASSTGMLHAYGVRAFHHLLAEVRPDVLFANRDEADLLDLWSGTDGPTVVVVKDGEHPTTVLWPGQPARRVPVPPVDDVRDRTGAGDAFAAGFLAARLDGADPETACAAGHARAALVLRSPGATLEDTERASRGSG